MSTQPPRPIAARSHRRRDGRAASPRTGPGPAGLAGGILFFLPVAWMVLTSFHCEADAATNPPTSAPR